MANLALGALLALSLTLLFVAEATAASNFPRVGSRFGVSCKAPLALVSVDVTWRNAVRSGDDRGFVTLVVSMRRGGAVLAREEAARRLGARRVQRTRVRFRLPFHASRRLCAKEARLEVVASHGEDFDGKGRTEVYRVAKRTLGKRTRGSRASASAAETGADCNAGGGTAKIAQGVDLHNCDLANVNIVDAELDFSNLEGVDLNHAIVTRADFSLSRMDSANLESIYAYLADFTNVALTRANLRVGWFEKANFQQSDLLGAMTFGGNWTGAGDHANLPRSDHQNSPGLSASTAPAA